MRLNLCLISMGLICASLSFSSCSTQGAGEELPYPMRPHSPEEELAGFTVPDGFVVELVASEKDGVINPIDLTFDDAGRLWTQTASMYPLDPVADIEWNALLQLMDDQEAQQKDPAFKRVLDLFQGRTPGDDKILVISDLYGKGPAKVNVWADGLAIPMSTLPYRKGLYVCHGSDLIFLEDTDNDGKADKRTTLFTGFGFTDTHTMAHALVRGPGGWIYFSHGGLNKGRVRSLVSDAEVDIHYSKIARFTPDGKKIQIYTSGLNNIWGFQLRHNGQWYVTEANDLGYTAVPLDPGAGFKGIGNDRMHPFQPWMPELHSFRVGGTGLSGLAFADDAGNGSSSFPAEWKDIAILANPITSTINAVKAVRNPDGTVTMDHLSDLLQSRDKFFRPVNLEFGPDGCLYVADWYNKIISHNEVATSHPDRDKSHGRIWRIRHKSQKPVEVVNYYELPAAELPRHLQQGATLWARRAALNQILDRPSEETRALLPELVALAANEDLDETTRIHALWAVEGLGHYDRELLTSLAKSSNRHVRREAARAVASYDVTADEAAALLGHLIEDPDPAIRAQTIWTLKDLGKASPATIALLIQASKPELPGNDLNGSYQRRFERYLTLITLEQYREELDKFLQSPAAAGLPAINRLWAAEALTKARKTQYFISLWPEAGIEKIDESTFISLSAILDQPRVRQIVQPALENREHAATYVGYALDNEQRVQGPALAGALRPAVVHLLSSGNETHEQFALDAIGRFKINVSQEEIYARLKNSQDPRTASLAIRALEIDPVKNKKTFLAVLEDRQNDLSLRIAALHGLAKADRGQAVSRLAELVFPLNAQQKRTVTWELSSTDQGSAVLLDAYKSKHLDFESFNFAAARRIYKVFGKDAAAAEIVDLLTKKRDEERAQFAARLAKYVAIAEKNAGDPKKGEQLFQTCLMCHRVGDKGQDIAPALDGSASRDNEALITAILDPDAAVEGGYNVYGVTRKDNSTVEGYLYQKDESGTTIAVMGGTKIFIPASEIKWQGSMGRRSFMPRGLIDDYTDEQVADLLAYIKTLK